MPLQQSGIELIVKNFRGFLSSMGRVNRAHQQAGKSADKAAKQIESLGNKMARTAREAQNAGERQAKAQGTLLEFLRKHGQQISDLQAQYQRYTRVLRIYQGIGEKTAAQEQAHNTVLEHFSNIQNRLFPLLQRRDSMMRTLSIATRNSDAAHQAAASSAQQYAAATTGATAATGGLSAAVAALQASLAALLLVLGAVVLAIGALWKAAQFALGVIKTLVTGGINLLVGALRQLLSVLDRVTRPLREFISRTLSVTLGIGLADAFRGVGQAIRNLVGDLDETLSLFQRLDIQFESLAARDIANEHLIPMGEAFQYAGERAQEMLRWVKDIAVTTPFTVRNLTTTLAMANAMGLNVEQSRRLTEATGNFVAAMGLTEDHMFRIIYNFGQMLAQGKLNGREFRDLANSFVPVWTMMRRMADQAGMTAEEFKELAFEGAIPVEAFFEEFIRMANEDFPNAMEKMARTWQGVINNIKDFIEVVIGVEIFGPTFDRMTSIAADALQKLLTPAVREAASTIGDTLLASLQRIAPAVNDVWSAIKTLASTVSTLLASLSPLSGQTDSVTASFLRSASSVEKFNMALRVAAVAINRFLHWVARFIRDFASDFSDGMEGIAASAYTWGQNIVATLARGMASAIKLIVAVINTISRILSYWLKGASPPRIAPELDRWGAEAMTEYWKGWLKGDFSVFNEIADMVESFIRSLSHEMEETSIVPMILGSREAISNAINQLRQGAISVGAAFDAIRQKATVLTEEFRQYIRAMLDVEAAQSAVERSARRVAEAELAVERASNRVRAVQEEINVVQDKYSKILDRLERQLVSVTDEFDEQQRLQKLNEAISSGLLTTEEKTRLEMEKRAIQIRQQIRATEDQRDAEVNTLETRLTALEAEEAVAQRRLEAAQEEQKAAEIALEAAEDRLETAEALIENQIKQNELIQEQIELLRSLAEAGGGAASDLSDLFSDLGDDAAGALSKIERGVQAAEDKFEEFWNELKFAEAEDILDEILTGLETSWNTFWDSEALEAPLKELNESLSALEGSVKGVIGAFSGAELDIPEQRVTNLGPTGIVVHTQLTPFQKFRKGLEEVTGALKQVDWETIGSSAAEAIIAVSNAVADTDWEKLGRAFSIAAEGMSNFLLGLAGIVEILRGGNVLELWRVTGQIQAIEFIDGWGDMLDERGIEIIDKSVLIGEGVEVETKWPLNRLAIWLAGEFLDSFLGPFDDIYRYLVGNSLVPDMMSEIYDIVTRWLGDTQSDWEEKWGAMKDFLVDPVSTTIDTFIYETIPTFFDNVTTFLTDTSTEWQDKWGGMKDYLEDPIGTTIASFKDNYLKKLTDFISGEFTEKFDTMRTDVLEPLQGAFELVAEKVGSVWSKLSNLASTIATFPISKWLKIIGAGLAGKLGISLPKEPEMQRGGFMRAGLPYITGEAGRELVVPGVNSYIFPNWLTERLLSPTAYASPSSGNTTVHLEVNPTYRNVQSEASVYYDALAALNAAVRR